MAESDLTYHTVRTHYSSIAREDGGQYADHKKKVALSFGYDTEDLAAIPEGANLGVSCGNPLTIAGLKTGETVIDLGSGAGFDVFQAARKIGPDGLAIGVDMSEDMLARARANATKASIKNVKFVLSPITGIPLDSGSADCIISNCVINLVPHSDKQLVFSEVYRLLKPGGRFAVSDILAKKEFSPEMQKNMGLYVGCISGASMVEEYEAWLKEAGFKDIMIVDKHNDLNIYKEKDLDQKSSTCCSLEATKEDVPEAKDATPSSGSTLSCCPSIAAQDNAETSYSYNNSTLATDAEAMKGILDIDFNEWVGSFSIYAMK